MKLLFEDYKCKNVLQIAKKNKNLKRNNETKFFLLKINENLQISILTIYKI